MPANRLQTYLIMLQTAATTLRFSLAVIIRAYTKTLSRDAVNSIIHRWSKRLLRIVKAEYTVHNPHNVQLHPDQKLLIMSNHASHYDIPLLILALPGGLRMIAKQELFRIPIFGQAMRRAEFVAINRDDREEAKRNLEEAKEKMLSGIGLWIAPEGTRSRDGKLGTFKKGGFMVAYQTGASIVPVTLKNTHKILAAEGAKFHYNQHIDIYIEKPLNIEDYDLRQRKQLIADAKQTIGQHLDNDKEDATC